MKKTILMALTLLLLIGCASQGNGRYKLETSCKDMLTGLYVNRELCR